LARARGRVLESPQHRDALTEEGPIRHMWDQFQDLGPIEEFVIDNTAMDPRATAMLIQKRMIANDLGFPALNL